jgi:rhodanese-related sulfurtransferase
MPNPLTAIAAAPPSEAIQHFASKLSLETDCLDVHHALKAGSTEFGLLDARSRASFASGHVPGAVHLPPAEITADRMMSWPQHTLFVVYCAGPHCKRAD